MSATPPQPPFTFSYDIVDDISRSTISDLKAHIGIASEADAYEPDRALGIKNEGKMDYMAQALERTVCLLEREKASWNRRRNEKHSLIFQLPQEVLTEILLFSIHWAWWDVEELRRLASVATRWRDTILSCNRFWPVIDVMASEEARSVAMKRNPKGLVDVWCWSDPSPEMLESFMRDLSTVDEKRIRTIFYEYRWNNSSFLDWLQIRTNYTSDLLMANVTVHPSTPPLLLTAGRSFRHIHLIAAPVSWNSSRLSNLHTLTLAELRGNGPTIVELYHILLSSPQLERLCLRNISANELETTTPPPSLSTRIHLPVLETLIFKNVYAAMPHTIVPLLRAPACKTVIMEGDDSIPLSVKSALELLSRVFGSLDDHLGLDVLDTTVHIWSHLAGGNEWVLWTHDRPGIDVEVTIQSPEDLSNLWSHISQWLEKAAVICGLDAKGLQSLGVTWNSGNLPFPSRVIEAFSRTLVKLELTDPSGQRLRDLTELLSKRKSLTSKPGYDSELPFSKLEVLEFRTTPSFDVNASLDMIVDCLTTRYPVIRQGGVAYPTPLKELELPFELGPAGIAARLPGSLEWDNILRLI